MLRKISDAKSVRSQVFFSLPRMSGTYDWTTLDDTFGEWTTLDNSFCLERSCASPPIDISLVKATMTYYSSLSTRGASCEWIDGPLGIVNSWIELHVPNGCVPDRLVVPSKDIFIPFIVYGYDAGDGCHLIESYNFNSERTKVDFTRLSAPSIRHQGGRKFLSEIQPQSVTKDVKQADEISVKQAEGVSVKQSDGIIPEAELDSPTRRKLDSARRRYLASLYKQRSEMEEQQR